jgi:hypothetical protein
MRGIYTSKGMSKKVWDARYTLGARYLIKNTVPTHVTNLDIWLAVHHNITFLLLPT